MWKCLMTGEEVQVLLNSSLIISMLQGRDMNSGCMMIKGRCFPISMDMEERASRMVEVLVSGLMDMEDMVDEVD